MPYLPLIREAAGRNVSQLHNLITVCLAGLGIALQILQLTKPFPAIFNSFICLLLQICFNLYFVQAYNVKLTFHRYFPASLGHAAVFSGIIGFNGVIIYSTCSPIPLLVVLPVSIFIFSAFMILRGYFFKT